MPVATALPPVASRPLHSSPLASSSSSLSNSLTLSQAKNHYNQAARSFLHRRHVDALLASEKAFLAFQQEHLRDRSLAERLVILRLTLLATVYRPHGATCQVELFDTAKKAGKLSSQDQTIVIALEALLSLPPLAFLARLWTDVLRFHIDVLPRIHSISSAVPPISTTIIAAEVDTLLSALQLPAGVVAAAIMGALRVDDESKPKEVLNGVKSKKEARPISEANMSEGLQSARSMCEWVMSAHSKVAGTYQSFSQAEREHLYQQYTRVLELYTLHILGTRLEQWELAHQVARCAVEIREDEGEMRDRQALLDQLTSAQLHLSTRGERRRIASEKARQRYEDEKTKRAASAEQQVRSTGDSTKKEKISNSIPLSNATSVISPESLSPVLPKFGRSDSGLSNTSSSTSASEMESEGGIPSRKKVREATKSPGDYAEKRGHISNQIDRHHKRSPLSSDEREASANSSRSKRIASSNILQGQIIDWIRSLSGNPYLLIRYLSALVATLFIMKRAITPARSNGSNLPKRVGAATETTRSRLELAKRQDESLIVTAARKVWSTLRMGSQVTYL